MMKRTFLLSGALAGFAALTSALATAAETTAEPAPTFNFRDPQLQWGPCPPFIPKGCEIAVLHGDPAKDNADVFFKVPANFTIPKHTHTSAERMVLVSGTLKISYDGEKPKTLRPGEYAYGPAKAPHMAVCAKGAPCVLFIAFEAPIDAFPTTPPGQ